MPPKSVNRTLPILILIVLAGLAFLFFRARDASELYKRELDVLVSNVSAADDKTAEIWKALLAGKITPSHAMKLLDEQFRAAGDALTTLEKMAPPAKTFLTGRGLYEKRSIAWETARTSVDYIFSLESSAHFRTYGLQNSGKQDHARGHEDTAEVLQKQIADLIKRFHAKEITGGVYDKPFKPAGDAQYVFIILLDALRADHVGAYGYKRPTTPFIDKLASEGLLFEKNFSQSSVTDTSVASLFTSLYPNTHKMFANTDWMYEYSLIDNFRKGGFLTGAFSGNSLICPEYHYDRGFDQFALFEKNRATIMVGETERWLESALPKHKKIFTYLHLYEPHDIYLAPPPFEDMFDPGYPMRALSFSLRNVLERKAKCSFNPYLENWDHPELVIECLKNTGAFPAEFSMRDVQNQEARYDGEIRYADSQVASFFGWLDRKGILGKSTVVIMSDHGESFMEHNQFQHGRVVYDNEIHVPLIFWRGHDNFGGKRESRQVQVIDILPTLFGLSGVPVPTNIAGKNLLDPASQKVSEVVHSQTQPYQMIASKKVNLSYTTRETQYKYISNFFGNRSELYDVIADPKEMKNICAQKPDVCAGMKTETDLWFKATDSAPPRPVKKQLDKNKLKKLRDMGYVND